MIIKDCPNCGGTHYGSITCPYLSDPCVVCGRETILACSDCAIDSGGKASIHVCSFNTCRTQHEAMHEAIDGEQGSKRYAQNAAVVAVSKAIEKLP